jgi:general stress protein 26
MNRHDTKSNSAHDTVRAHDNDPGAQDSRPEWESDQEARHLPDLVPDGLCVAMIMTMIGRSHSSRPVTVADVREHRLSFLVARHADWVAAIEGEQALVHVTIADNDAARYLALNGSAIVVRDEEEAQRLWTPAARVWFDGAEDPNLAVLHFDVTDGHYWSGPAGSVGRAIAFARAVISKDDSALGTDGPVALD